MSAYSIRDLEQVSGIKAHTLRVWEQRYAIIRPKRTNSNIRTYDDQDLKLILTISLLKENGYKISEISKMSQADMSQEVIVLSEKQSNYSEQIHALTLAMIELDEERFDKIIRANSLKVGFETVMIHLIYPFLSRIGTLWITGTVGPAQEHFVTNLVRQKIIAAIEGEPNQRLAENKKFLLFLPEGEWHEIGLLFAQYLLRNRQHHVIYLGQSLPLNELSLACKAYKPDFLFTVLTSVPDANGVDYYLNQLAHHCPEPQILITGQQVVHQPLSLPEKMAIVNTFNDLDTWL